jgi:energy-coupling factor transporter ATP-binding protein EcfA2
MDYWWLKSRTFRREVVLLFVLAVLISLSVVRLFDEVFPVVLASQSGVVDLLASTVSTLFGVSRDAILVVPIGMFVGLVVLLGLDHYKYMYAYLLGGGTVLGFLVLVQQSVIIPPSEWEWAANLPFLALGIALGFGVGGWRWEGRLPIRASTFEHDFLRQNARVDQYEFDRALPRLLWLVATLLVFVLFERTVRYQLVPPRLIGLDLEGFGTNALSVLILLGILAGVRTYTKDTSTVLIGPTGSGKSTMMAGLSYTAPDHTTATSDQPLTTLTDVFAEAGFDGIDSTARSETIPVQLTYKHGFLFPRKITVNTVDYAGEHIPDLTVPGSDDDVVTSDFDEAYDVARRIRWQADRKATDGMVTFVDTLEEIGVDPYDDRFDWPSRVRDGRSLSDDMVILKIIEDMLYHADSVGLLLPMDDFASYAVERGTHPSWVSIDSTADGDIEAARDREKRNTYLMKYKKIYDRLVEEQGKDIFYVFTLADVAINDFQYEHDEDLWQPLLSRPNAFTDHIVRNFVPRRARDKLGGLYDGRSDEYDPDNAFAVNFAVEEATEDSETPVQLQEDPELFGTRALLERIGRE